LVFLVVAAIAGLGIFAFMVYRAVEIQTVEADRAFQRFAATRATLPPGQPLVALDDAGNLVRREEPRTNSPDPISRLRVLAYHARSRRLASANVALWFFKLKAPAAQIALRDTGFDLERLGLTTAELSRHGPAVVVDSQHANGDRLLVWTER
jgi:hypothetical protein